MRQGAFESKKSFKQCYTNALKAYKDQKNLNMTPQAVAMDFSRKLDNEIYVEFNITFINGLQMNSVRPLLDLNDFFYFRKYLSSQRL